MFGNFSARRRGLDFVRMPNDGCALANIFATQFHPERPPYEWSNDKIGHTPGDIAVSQYLANFIAAKMRLNNHTFENATDVEALRIARFPRVDHGWGHKTYYVYSDEN